MSTDPFPRREAALGLLALLTLPLVACDEPTRPPPPKVPASPEIAPLERRMFELVNRDRAAHGKPALAYDPRLADVARAHAADMRDHRFFAHDSPTTGSLDDRLSSSQIWIAVARENLAEAADVELAQQSLMRSPGHFENLMAEDITHVGVGIVKGGLESRDMLLFVQVFARPVVQEKPEQARALVLEKITRARAARGKPAPNLSPVLSELAGKYVQLVDDTMDRAALDVVGSKVLADVRDRGAGLTVIVSGQRVIAASEYEPSAVMLDKSPLTIGVGAAPARDEKGRPAVKILVLVGP